MSTRCTGTASWWRGARRMGRCAMLNAALLFKDALYGALVLSVVCAALGVYVVLRRIVFVGAAIAELSSFGIALSLWLAGAGWFTTATSHPVAFSLVFALGGALF